MSTVQPNSLFRSLLVRLFNALLIVTISKVVLHYICVIYRSSISNIDPNAVTICTSILFLALSYAVVFCSIRSTQLKFVEKW